MTNDRLSFFIQNLHGGGAERAVVRLVNGIVARDIPTDLVLVNKTGEFVTEVDKRVDVIELPHGRTATSIFGLRNYLQQRRPKALVAHMTHTNIAAIAATAFANHKPRLVVVEHNRFDVARASRRGLPRLAYDLVPFLYRRADVVAVVAEGMRQRTAEAARIPIERVIVLTNPVVSPDMLTSAKEDIQHPWFQPGQPPVILAVGRLTRQKNFSMLVSAFALLRKETNARLLILGEGEERGALEALIAEHALQEDVGLPGFVKNPFAYMSRSAVFALSSDWEGLPTVLIEALACGVSVVSTDCESGPAEILANGKYGDVVPTGDVASFAKALKGALLNQGNREIRIERARDFGLERAIEGYLRASGMQPDTP